MATFKLRRVDLPLFGCVEVDDREDLRKQFAAGRGDVALEIDDATYTLLADELRLEARELVQLAQRYSAGGFLPGTAGLGGTYLGDFGELVTYLVNHAAGRQIARVFSYSANGTPLAGNRFPQPDFLVGASPKQYAVEVKATEAFRVQDLKRVNTYRRVHACNAVRALRSEALPQLGYSGVRREAQEHKLEVQGGLVPFPATDGQAVAILAHDGRTSALREDVRYKSPPECREADPPRSCWSCVAEGVAAVMVTMTNEPGRLALPGATPDGWLSEYIRWMAALTSSDPEAMRAATDNLLALTRPWLESPGLEASRRDLAFFWGAYLSESLASRGFASDVHRELLTNEDIETWGWVPPEPGVPIQEVEVALARALLQAPNKDTLRLSIAIARGGDQRLSAEKVGSDWRFTFLSETWLRRQTVADDAGASRLVAQMISLVGEVIDSYPMPFPVDPRVRRLVARVGDTEVLCGWESFFPEDERYRRFRHAMEPHWWHPDGPGWLYAFVTGDPRVRVRVHPDGRTELTMAEEVGRWNRRP